MPASASDGYASAASFLGTAIGVAARGAAMTASASLPLPRRRGDAAAGAGNAVDVAAIDVDKNRGKARASSGKGRPLVLPAKVQRKRNAAAVVAPLVFALLLACLLLYGWQNKDEGQLSPDSGLGYWLGIAGGSAMLLLLGYPLRKRVASLKMLGSVTGWFRLHMMLGIIGPALILLHSNFKLGSLNSNVALLAMLVVAGSGLVGRYLYGHIHLGLYGRRAHIGELQAEVEALKGAIEGALSLPAEMFAVLDAHAERANTRGSGVLASLSNLLALRWRSKRMRGQLLRAAERHIGVEGKRFGPSWRVRRGHVRRLRQLLEQYFAAVNKTAAFVLYERLFALWHVLHLPLFAILVFAAIIHVLAVHLY